MTGLIKSWVPSANSADTDFPLNNLPYGSFLTSQSGGHIHCGVAIGDFILDVSALETGGLLGVASGEPVFSNGRWNALMAKGPDTWAAFRQQLTDILRANSRHKSQTGPYLIPRAGTRLVMPFQVSHYTDFYSSYHHASNVGAIFRGDKNALPPNWLHMPLGYNGRASSVVISGTEVRRPWGQIKGPDDPAPRFAPSDQFDFELELGAIVGVASDKPISVARADANIFGYLLLNDWSARDIQAWEYQPLGPFQAKATATTISPWIVTKAALQPFRCATPARQVPLLPHLQDTGPMLYDIDLQVNLAPAGGVPTTLTRTNYDQMYYSAAQQLAHHTTSGCRMEVGDILGSGTISGPQKHQRGSLLELGWGGTDPATLKSGEPRSFLQDGDRVQLQGAARGLGYKIGFGTCDGTVLPASKGPYRT